jgi:hypothetical protein
MIFWQLDIQLQKIKLYSILHLTKKWTKNGEVYIHTKTCPGMFTKTLFIKSPNWKQFRFLGGFRKWGISHNGILYYLAITKELMSNTCYNVNEATLC